MKTPPLGPAGLALCVAFLSTGRLSAAISLSSIDTFATTGENWVEGNPSPNPPVRNSAVGRDGVSPGHLVNLSDGSGAGGSQVMWTESSDWIGNYASASVTGLEFWADNRSGNVSIINLRIAFDGPGGWFVSESRAVSDTVAGTEWTKLEFALIPSAFTWISGGGGTGNFTDTISGVTRLEVLAASSLPAYGLGGDILIGQIVVSDIRFDDFRAVPEPAAATLLGLGILGAAFRRRRGH